MLARARALSILRSLRALPEDKVAEVEDFVLYLEQRYAVDDSDVWTDEDMRDITEAAFAHAQKE